MAKKTKSIAFKNATISIDDMTITEFTKDDTKVYDLKKVLQDWDNINDISLTIKQDNDVPADE